MVIDKQQNKKLVSWNELFPNLQNDTISRVAVVSLIQEKYPMGSGLIQDIIDLPTCSYVEGTLR